MKVNFRRPIKFFAGFLICRGVLGNTKVLLPVLLISCSLPNSAIAQTKADCDSLKHDTSLHKKLLASHSVARKNGRWMSSFGAAGKRELEIEPAYSWIPEGTKRSSPDKEVGYKFSLDTDTVFLTFDVCGLDYRFLLQQEPGKGAKGVLEQLQDSFTLKKRKHTPNWNGWNNDASNGIKYVRFSITPSPNDKGYEYFEPNVLDDVFDEAPFLGFSPNGGGGQAGAQSAAFWEGVSLPELSGLKSQWSEVKRHFENEVDASIEFSSNYGAQLIELGRFKRKLFVICPYQSDEARVPARLDPITALNIMAGLNIMGCGQ